MMTPQQFANQPAQKKQQARYAEQNAAMEARGPVPGTNPKLSDMNAAMHNSRTSHDVKPAKTTSNTIRKQKAKPSKPTSNVIVPQGTSPSKAAKSRSSRYA